MNRRGFISFLIGAPVTRALPWKTIAKFAPAPIADDINVTISEIIQATIKKYQPELIANIQANNALLKRMMRK